MVLNEEERFRQEVLAYAKTLSTSDLRIVIEGGRERYEEDEIGDFIRRTNQILEKVLDERMGVDQTGGVA